MVIEPHSKLVMIGDSITDCGRGQPIGESFKDGLGNGYVSLVNALLTSTYPEHRIRIINTGLGGNTVLDLEARWEQLDVYSATLDKLLTRTRPRLKGLVLLSPYFIEPNKNEPMCALMYQYSAAMRRAAARHRAIFVDVQAAFDTLLKDIHPMTLAWDRVHPDQSGHMLIARAFLDAIGFCW